MSVEWEFGDSHSLIAYMRKARNRDMDFDYVDHVEIDGIEYERVRTCRIGAGSWYDRLLDESHWYLSCGHMATGRRPNYCPECGAEVV